MSESAARGFDPVVERGQRDAFVRGIFLGETDRPAPRLPQLIVVGFPLVADAGAAVGEQTRQLGMIGKLLARLLERVFDGEDQERMPACRISAVEDQTLRVVRREPAYGVAPRPPPSCKEVAGAVAMIACPRSEPGDLAMSDVKHGTAPESAAPVLPGC